MRSNRRRTFRRRTYNRRRSNRRKTKKSRRKITKKSRRKITKRSRRNIHGGLNFIRRQGKRLSNKFHDFKTARRDRRLKQQGERREKKARAAAQHQDRLMYAQDRRRDPEQLVSARWKKRIAGPWKNIKHGIKDMRAEHRRDRLDKLEATRSGSESAQATRDREKLARRARTLSGRNQKKLISELQSAARGRPDERLSEEKRQYFGTVVQDAAAAGRRQDEAFG